MDVCCWRTCDDVDERRLLTAAGAETADDANDDSEVADVRRSMSPGTVRLLPAASSAATRSYTTTPRCTSTQPTTNNTSRPCSRIGMHTHAIVTLTFDLLTARPVQALGIH